MGTPYIKPGSCFFLGAICKPDTSSWLIFRARERNVTKLGARKDERPELKGQELPSSSGEQCLGEQGDNARPLHAAQQTSFSPRAVALPAPGTGTLWETEAPRWHQLGPPSVHPSICADSLPLLFLPLFLQFSPQRKAPPKGKLPPRPGLPMEPQEGHQPSQDPPFPPASPPLCG